MARETKHLHESFQNRAVQPLKNLTEQMKQGTDPKNPPADLKQMQRMADQLQKDLEAMRERTQSVAKAENQVRTNAEQALKQLEHEMVQQDSKLTAQELAELQKAVKAMRQEMEKLEGQQGNLMRDNQSLLPEREQRQAALEKAEDRQFAATRQLQGSEEMRRAQQQAGVRNEESGNRNPAPQLTAEKPRFAPALGGPRPELPPRSANRGNTPPDRQGQLHERQADRMDQLSEAEQSLRSDEQSLQNMREQLERAMTQSQQGNQRPGIEQSEQPDNQRPAQSAQGDRQLSETLQSPAMQRATQMAERLRQMRRQEGQQPGEAKPSESHAATPNTHGGTSPVAAEAELARLDPATRAAILKLQPQIREELLQGMRDAGPDGYQKFIEDYFKRLAEVKK